MTALDPSPYLVFRSRETRTDRFKVAAGIAGGLFLFSWLAIDFSAAFGITLLIGLPAALGLAFVHAPGHTERRKQGERMAWLAERSGGPAQYAGGNFPGLEVGRTYAIVFTPAGMGVKDEVSHERLVFLEWPGVLDLEVSGAGQLQRGGGFIGGGFGLEGAAEGMAIAAVANRLSTRTSYNTTLSVRLVRGQAAFAFLDVTPEELKRWIHWRRPTAEPPVAEAKSSPLPAALREIAELHRTGALTPEEFAAAKARLLT